MNTTFNENVGTLTVDWTLPYFAKTKQSANEVRRGVVQQHIYQHLDIFSNQLIALRLNQRRKLLAQTLKQDSYDVLQGKHNTRISQLILFELQLSACLEYSIIN